MILMLPFAMQFTGLFNFFAFVYVKPDYKEICEEIFSFFLRKELMSSFLLRFKANYLKEMRSYHYFPLWIPIPYVKIYCAWS